MSDYSTIMNCPDCGGRVTDPDREGCPTCKPEQYRDVSDSGDRDLSSSGGGDGE